MEIYVNDDVIQLEEGKSIKDLIESLGIESTNGLAIAVNGEVAPGERYERFPLQEGDKILLITAAQGG